MTKEEMMQEAMRDCYNFSGYLEDTMKKEIISTQDTISSKLIDVINEEAQIFNEYKIMEKVEDVYIRKIQQVMQKQIAKISENLYQATSSIVRLLENKSEKELNSIFNMLTNEMIRMQSEQIFDVANEEITSEIYSMIVRSIVRNYELERIIGENRMYDIADNVKYSMRSPLNMYTDDLMYEFKNNLRDQLNLYRNKLMTNIKSVKIEVEKAKEPPLERAQESDVKDITLVASFANIAFEQTPSGIVAIDTKTNTGLDLFKTSDGLIISKDKEIEISNTNGKTTIINKDRAFTFDGKYFAMGPIDNPEQIRIDKVNKDYQLSYSGKIINDPIKRGFILESIKKYNPVFYARMMKNSKFVRMANESATKENESNEIIQDEKGISRINPLHREEYIEKLRIVGLQVIEDEKGVSVIDKEGKSYPITKNGYNKVGNGQLTSSTYLITKTKMSGPMLHYAEPNLDFYCASDYRNMNLFVGKKHYFLGIKEDGTVEISYRENGEEYKNRDIVTEAFQQFMPNALIKFEQICNKIEQENKEKEGKKENNDNSLQDTNNEAKKMLNELNSEPNSKTDQIKQGIEDELTVLKQDPSVQRYIELLKRQAKNQNNSHQAKIA